MLNLTDKSSLAEVVLVCNRRIRGGEAMTSRWRRISGKWKVLGRNEVWTEDECRTDRTGQTGRTDVGRAFGAELNSGERVLTYTAQIVYK